VRAPPRGHVWVVDLGLAAKVRPCVVLSVSTGDDDRSLVTVVPHTTTLRGSRFEVVNPVRFLKPGAFDTQSIITIPTVRLIRSLGVLTTEQLAAIEVGVCSWLGLKIGF